MILKVTSLVAVAALAGCGGSNLSTDLIGVLS